MNKRFPILAGLVLILVGLMALVCNGMVVLTGMDAWRWGPWRLWPMIVIGAGLVFVLPPLMMPARRGLGVFFIPGVPILTTGSILLFASVFNAWGAWSWLWPLEVLAVAVGFLFAAIFTRTVWLIIPAVFVGLNGPVFLFCAVTGLWSWWSVLWTIEPMSIGLGLAIVGVVKRWIGVFLAGVIICGLAGASFFGMPVLLFWADFVPVWWLFRLWGPALIILIGFLLLASSLLGRSPARGLAGD